MKSIFSNPIFVLLFSAQFLFGQNSTIAVTVKTLSDQTPIQDAQVSYYDNQSNKITVGFTNSEGHLTVDVPFRGGEDVILEVSKYGEFTMESRTHRLSLNGINDLYFFLREFTGIKINGQVYNGKAKFDSPVVGAIVKVPNPAGPLETYPTNLRGEFEFNTLFAPGESLALTIEADGFETMRTSKVIEKEGPRSNQFVFRLEPIPSFDLCKCMYYSGGGLALLSVSAYIKAGISYKDYEDFGNENREQDYNNTTTFNRISIVAGAAAIGAVVSGYFCKKAERKKRVQKLRRARIGFFDQPGDGDALSVGLAYQF